MKILIVDDKAENRYLMEKILDSSGYIPLSVSNGAEAISVALKNPPDLIISDILMPVMDGFTLCREWHKNEKLKNIPFIFYTATYTDSKDAELGLNLGADDFLVKPMEYSILIKKIDEILKKHKNKKSEKESVVLHEEKIFLKQYNEALIRKLEDKITTLEKAEKILQQKNEALKKEKAWSELIISSAPNIIVILGENSKILTFNSFAEEITGYKAEEVIGKLWIENFIPEEQRDELYSVWNKITTNKLITQKYENLIVTKSGEKKLISWNNSLISNTDDSVCVLSIGEDITEKKRTEERIKQSEETFRNIFQNAQVGLFRTRISDGKILESNEQLAKMFGYDNRDKFVEEYVTSKNYVDAGTREKMIDELKKNGFINNFEARFYRKDHSIFWAKYSARIFPEKEWIEGVAEDITDRKNVEEALSESEKNYREIFNSTQEAIFIDDADTGKMLDVNEAMLNMYGYDIKEEVLKGDIGDLSANIEPYTEKRAQELIKKAILEGPQIFEWLARRKDGSTFWIEMQLKKTEIGGKNRILAVGRDITERKRIETMLKEQSDLLQTIFDNIPIMIAYFDKDGNFKKTNKALIETLGWNFEELSNINLLEVCYPDPQLRKEALNWMLSGDLRWKEFQTTTKNGTVIDTVWTNRRLADGSNIGIGQDITERKKVEKSLIESETRYRNLINGMNDTVWVIDFDTSILDVNEAACKALGYTRDELLSKKIQDIDVHLKPEHINYLVENMQIDLHQVFESYHTSKDGRNIPVEISSSLITYKGKTAIISIARDTTERRRAEEQERENLVRQTRYYSTLSELIKYTDYFSEDLRKNLNRITELSTQMLNIERVSIWKYSEDFNIINCIELYERSKNCHTSGFILNSSEFPEYVETHKRKEVIAVEDVYNDTKTKHIPISYLDENNIKSLIDVPIFVSGILFGLLSFEQVGTKRKWLIDEQQMVITLASFVSLYFETYERKKTQEALRASEIKYRSIFDNSQIAILLTIPDGTVLSVNDYGCWLFGRTRDEICKLGRSGFVDLSDPRLPILLEERKRTGFASGELTFIRADGTKFEGEITSTIFKDKDGNERTSMIIQDITERKLIEEKIKKINEELEQKVAEKTKELNERIIELERFHDATIDRELRMKELRDEIEKLKRR